jgi:hypothetical protein
VTGVIRELKVKYSESPEGLTKGMLTGKDERCVTKAVVFRVEDTHIGNTGM